MRERLRQYIEGLEEQLKQKRHEASMVEGALQFARQLLDDLDAETAGGADQGDGAIVEGAGNGLAPSATEDDNE